MAVVELINQNESDGGRTISWAAMRPGDVGVPFEYPARRHVSVATAGTFSGGSVTFEGSNDGEHWIPMKGPLGRDIKQSSPLATQVMGAPRFVRPHCSSGTDDTLLVMSLHIRKNR